MAAACCAGARGLPTLSSIAGTCWPTFIAHGHDTIVYQNVIDLLDIKVNVVVMVLMLVAVLADIWHSSCCYIRTPLLLSPKTIAPVKPAIAPKSMIRSSSIMIRSSAPWTHGTNWMMIPSRLMITIIAIIIIPMRRLLRF